MPGPHLLVSVRDPQLDETIDEVIAASRDGRVARGTVILHTSAIAEPAGLRTLNDSGFPGGTFHPLVPFSDPEMAADLLRKGWVGIDGENGARNTSSPPYSMIRPAYITAILSQFSDTRAMSCVMSSIAFPLMS